METKTAKITSVQENRRSYQSQNGMVYIHLIQFEGSLMADGRPQDWEYHSKSQTCVKFKVGETSTFDTEIKVSGQFTNYKIKPAQAPGVYSGGQRTQTKDQGVITALSCLSSACIAVQQSSNSTNSELILKMAEWFFQWASKKSTL